MKFADTERLAILGAELEFHNSIVTIIILSIILSTAMGEAKRTQRIIETYLKLYAWKEITKRESPLVTITNGQIWKVEQKLYLLSNT